MKDLILNKICPFAGELNEVFLRTSKQVEKDRLRPLLIQFKQDLKELPKSNVIDSRSNVSLPNSSSNESISEDIYT